jgi:hypothetical protein
VERSSSIAKRPWDRRAIGEITVKPSLTEVNCRLECTGAVRDESYMPLPLPSTTQTSTTSTTVCTTSSDEESALAAAATQNSNAILGSNKDDAELLRRLASRHYYSTTTALAITVGVGCILLVLNMLIFAGIYYQRDRDKKRAAMACASNNGQESLPMSSRSAIKATDTPTTSRETPPCYTSLPKSPSSIQVRVSSPGVSSLRVSSLRPTPIPSRSSASQSSFSRPTRRSS